MTELREKAQLLRLLGHRTRLAIIERLAKGPRCVTDIQELLDVRQANISQHLAALRSARIVDFCEHGKTRCYYLSRPALAKSLLWFIQGDYPVVERSAEWVRHHSKPAANGKRRDEAPSTPRTIHSAQKEQP